MKLRCDNEIQADKWINAIHTSITECQSIVLQISQVFTSHKRISSTSPSTLAFNNNTDKDNGNVPRHRHVGLPTRNNYAWALRPTTSHEVPTWCPPRKIIYIFSTRGFRRQRGGGSSKARIDNLGIIVLLP